jgi:hypothetical protein
MIGRQLPQFDNITRIQYFQKEELIYNHSFTCDRDSAVKQLLGHYVAAQSCYSSARLLPVTLVMEPHHSFSDKQILEGYVNSLS